MESNSKKSWYLLEYLGIVVCTYEGIAKVGHVYNLLCICLKIYLRTIIENSVCSK